MDTSFRFNGWLHIMVANALSILVSGCDQHVASRIMAQRHTANKPEVSSSGISDELQERRELGRHVRYMRLIHSLRAWPREGESDFTREDWKRIAIVALELQKGQPSDVNLALKQFVAHFETAFEVGIDPIAETSKPYLMLRIMFEIPETALAEDEPPGSFAGFCFTAKAPSMNVPQKTADPVTWGKVGPFLGGFLAGFDGPGYDAAFEYDLFREKYPFRKDLSSLIN